MKTRQGYSLILDGDRRHLVGVVPGEETPYRIETAPVAAPDLAPLADPHHRTVLDLPDEQVHLMIASLPPLKGRALDTAIQGMVVRQQGGQPGQWITRSTPLPRSQGPGRGGQEHAVVFAPLDLVSERFTSATDLGCRAVGLLPDYLALDELYRRHGVAEDAQGPWNLVHIGPEQRFLCVGDEHGLLFSRPLPDDLSGGAHRDEFLERLVTEIERSSFFAQQAEHSMVVGRIVLCGQPDLVDDLAALLADRTEVPLQTWRPEELFTGAADTAAWTMLPNLARAVAALHGPACEILPPGAKPDPLKDLQRYAGFALAAFVSVAVPMLLAGGLFTTYVQRSYLKCAEQRTDQLYTRAGAAAADYLQNRALQARQQNMDLLAGGQPDVAALLEDLASRTPRDVIYGGLELTEQEDADLRLVLRGQSLGRTGETAQEVFLDFHGRLAGYDRLVELSEPVYLEISGVTDARTPRSRVAFTLEYAVPGEVTP
ncbi:MAG: hypothetical protein GY838_02450 [bacterium]|nr:hypothetical protein [bacterium]